MKYTPDIDDPIKKTPNHFPLGKVVCSVYLYVVFHFVASFLANTECQLVVV